MTCLQREPLQGQSDLSPRQTRRAARSVCPAVLPGQATRLVCLRTRAARPSILRCFPFKFTYFMTHDVSLPLTPHICHVIPTKWRSYGDRRFYDVTSLYVDSGSSDIAVIYVHNRPTSVCSVDPQWRGIYVSLECPSSVQSCYQKAEQLEVNLRQCLYIRLSVTNLLILFLHISYHVSSDPS